MFGFPLAVLFSKFSKNSSLPRPEREDIACIWRLSCQRHSTTATIYHITLTSLNGKWITFFLSRGKFPPFQQRGRGRIFL